MRRIERFVKRPEIAQEQWLQKLLLTARNTEFGKQHHFARIRNQDDFARQVPAYDYERVKPFITRMMHGEKNILWPGSICWYSKSSGTTSDKSKFIPVPYANMFGSHIAGSWDALALLYANKPNLEIFKRKNLLLVGSYDTLPGHPQTRFGDVSAVLAYHMPAIGRMFYIPDIQTAVEPNFELKLERIAQIATRRTDIAMIGGVPTWIIVLFRRMLEISGKSNMLEIWPNMQAYMHGGVGFDPYRKTFQEFIPNPNFAYQEIYNASEGFFGAQMDLGIQDMLMLADSGVYYEFVPMEEWDKEFPKTRTMADVEIGKNYAIMISANNGLWRYLPGDTVVFTRKNPHCFTITGRTKQFINAFGEEVMVGDTDKALAEACRQLDVSIAEYTAAPVYMHAGGRGGHEWIVEFDKAPTDMERFNQVLDESLQKINSDYEAKRFKSMALDRLQLHAVPRGTFHRWMRARGKYGSQSKIPRLANHRQFIDDILQFVREV